jgi:ACR3 family arsenite transporter
MGGVASLRGSGINGNAVIKFQPMKFFEKYLTVWVSLCIAAGIGLGKILGNSVSVLESWQIYTINIPVAVLVWMMIYPMMVQIDFSSIGGVSKIGKGWR